MSRKTEADWARLIEARAVPKVVLPIKPVVDAWASGAKISLHKK